MTMICLSLSDYSAGGQRTMRGSVCSGCFLDGWAGELDPAHLLVGSSYVPVEQCHQFGPGHLHLVSETVTQIFRENFKDHAAENLTRKTRKSNRDLTSKTMVWIFAKVRLLCSTLKYMGSTLCLTAWAFPTSSSTDETFSGSWRFSTTVLIAFMTRPACFLSWVLFSISSGSSISRNWLKYCFADGKLTKNLENKGGQTKCKF